MLTKDNERISMSIHACNELCSEDIEFHWLQKELQYDAFEQVDGDWYALLKQRLIDRKDEMPDELVTIEKLIERLS